MEFLKLGGLTVNLAEIEAIINEPGVTSSIRFRSGQTLPVHDTVAAKIESYLKNTNRLKE